MDRSSEDAGTRRRLFRALKGKGPSTAERLAAELQLTKMGVLRHLHAARDAGLVGAVSEPKGRGRPSLLWTLTAEADKVFPDAHAELAVSLLDQMQTAFGADGMNQLLTLRTQAQVDRYAARMHGARSTLERLRRLAAMRTEEGYMAQVERAGRDYLLIERHCPICSAAKNCTGLCAAEATVFSALFPNHTVERTEHLLAGDWRCAYRVQRKEPPES